MFELVTQSLMSFCVTRFEPHFHQHETSFATKGHLKVQSVNPNLGGR